MGGRKECLRLQAEPVGLPICWVRALGERAERPNQATEADILGTGTQLQTTKPEATASTTAHTPPPNRTRPNQSLWNNPTVAHFLSSQRGTGPSHEAASSRYISWHSRQKGALPEGVCIPGCRAYKNVRSQDNGEGRLQGELRPLTSWF